jgi:hypothetical protein
MNESDLDALLSAPLRVVADAGFSARVAVAVARRESWRERLTTYAPIAAIAAVVPFLPGAQIADAASHLTPLIANSVALSIAAAALILTISFEQRLREWQSAL